MEAKVIRGSTPGAVTGALLGTVIAWAATQTGLDMPTAVANALGVLLLAALSGAGALLGGWLKHSTTSTVSRGHDQAEVPDEDRGVVGLVQVIYVLLAVILIVVLVGVLGRVL